MYCKTRFTHVQNCQQTSNGTLGIPNCTVEVFQTMGTLWDCTIHPTVPFPTAYRVHPISLYHGRDWTDWNCTKVSHFPPPTGFIPSHCTMGGTGQTGVVPKCPPFAVPCTYCPSRPIVQWEGLDRQGLYQSIPFAMPCTYCPSHPIVPNQNLLGEHAPRPP